MENPYLDEFSKKGGNPYLDEYSKKWFWYDETELSSGPYATWEEADKDLQKYIKEVLKK